jgi:hypothetical protein
MANINHEVIADPYIHEPKGVASALADKVYVSNGTGSGTWKKLSPSSLAGITGNGTVGTFLSIDGTGNFVFLPAPHGQTDFFDATLAAPYTLSATTSYQKLAPTTVGQGSPALFTEGTNARLTYTGDETVSMAVNYNLSLNIGSSAKDVTIAVYKNGEIANGRTVSTTSSSTKINMSGMTIVEMAQNDYVEIYAKISATDTINVYGLNLNAIVAGA